MAINYRYFGYLENSIMMARIILKELCLRESTSEVKRQRLSIRLLLTWLYLQFIEA